MEDKELISKIKKLRDIKPNPNWVNFAEEKLNDRIGLKEEKYGFLNWLIEPHPMALVAFSLMFIIGGPWLTLKTAESSLPGEFLYSVKKIGESIQTKVVSEKEQIELQVDFASRRIEELTKVNGNILFSEDLNKEEKAKEALNGLKQNLTSISAHLDKIEADEEKKVAIVKEAQQIKEELSKNKENSSAEMQNDLIEAEELNNQILSILTKDKEEKEEESATSTQETIIYTNGTETSTEPFVEE